MKLFIKIFLTLLVITVVSWISYGIYNAGMGNYIRNASFINTIFILAGLLLGVVLMIVGLKRLWIPCILLGLLTSCNYAKSNQQVLVSEDCGMNWKQVNAGDAVPKAGMNYCYMKVVIPNYPMQGDSRFVSNLKDKVRVEVHIDYDYSITNPLAFIKQAKSLGKANTDADSEGAIDSNFEGAENAVIDKRIRDVSKNIFINEDIIEMNQSELEDKLHTETNKILEPLGVHLNFITLTFDLDEQTRQSIDIATAMKIYESRNLADLGKQVMAARAGATKIIIGDKTTTKDE